MLIACLYLLPEEAGYAEGVFSGLDICELFGRFSDFDLLLQLSIVCGLWRDGAQEQIGSSCCSRNIKLRVNLAPPHMMEEGEKEFRQHGAICPRTNYYIKRIITFLISARSEGRRKAGPKVVEKYH